MQKLVLFIGDLQGEISRLNDMTGGAAFKEPDSMPAEPKRARKRSKKNSGEEAGHWELINGVY